MFEKKIILFLCEIEKSLSNNINKLNTFLFHIICCYLINIIKNKKLK